MLQVRTVESMLADTICLPSGLNRTLQISSECPDNDASRYPFSVFQILIELSSPADASFVPSGLNATEIRPRGWPLIFFDSPEARSHSRIEPSLQAAATRVPFKSRATPQISPSEHSNTRACCRLSRFQTRTVLSEPPETSDRPSRLNTRLRTHSVWPFSGATSVPAAVSQILIVLSGPLDASCRPSAL